VSPKRITALGKSTGGIVSAALVVIAVIAVYDWMVSPHLGYLNAMQRLQPVVDEVAGERDRLCQILGSSRQRLRALQEELAEVRGRLFSREESKAFVPILQSLVEDAGCVLLLAAFTDRNDTTPARGSDQPAAVKASHVSLTVLGQYEQVIALLERVQDSQPKIWVDSCRLELSDAGSGQLCCQLALTAYALGEQRESY
jgi:hypothetical protein